MPKRSKRRAKDRLLEEDMLRPVLRLFPKRRFIRFVEVPLGAKRIDLLCIERPDYTRRLCIELKINAWKKALRQAVVNFRIAQESYIAIWHEHCGPVRKNFDLLKHYGVGFIVVYATKAEIELESSDAITRIPREKKVAFYRELAQSV